MAVTNRCWTNAIRTKGCVGMTTYKGFLESTKDKQRIYRERRGWGAGVYRGKEYGHLLAMPEAQDELLNFLTPRIGKAVERALLNKGGGLIQVPRLYDNMVSSQPLCFNLFGELSMCEHEPSLCALLGKLIPGGAVTGITKTAFEYSPGRNDPKYLGDKSAFDFYVEYIRSSGGRGFVGFEVKYVEDMCLNSREGSCYERNGARYEEIADYAGLFKADMRVNLRRTRLQQLWRDHLLCYSILKAHPEFSEGCFVLLYPKANANVEKVMRSYKSCLSAPQSLIAVTLEELVGMLDDVGAGEWVRLFRERYLE